MKKVVIIDDESAGRQLIKQYLEDYPELILLGEANNGVDDHDCEDDPGINDMAENAGDAGCYQ